jgi:hypothetical protein
MGFGTAFWTILRRSATSPAVLTGSFFASTVAMSGHIEMHKKHATPDECDDHALGRSRVGYGTKIPLICEKGGKPIAAEVGTGQTHQSKFFERVLQKIAIRAERGRLRKNPEKIAGDKGDSSTQIRDWIKSKGTGDEIPTSDDEQRTRVSTNSLPRSTHRRGVHRLAHGAPPNCHSIR